jgi:Ca2+-binding RTX toxin-like protein
MRFLTLLIAAALLTVSAGAAQAASKTPVEPPTLACIGLPSDVEDDAVVDVDGYFSVVGTWEDDVFAGSEASDYVIGAGGDDEICGEAGDDILSGGSGNDAILAGDGRDQVTGGEGDDRIYAKDGSRDTIRCGRGEDVVYADWRDSVARDCERIK